MDHSDSEADDSKRVRFSSKVEVREFEYTPPSPIYTDAVDRFGQPIILDPPQLRPVDRCRSKEKRARKKVKSD